MPYYSTTPSTQNTNHTILTGRAESNQHPANAITVDTVQLSNIIDGSSTTVQDILENLAGLCNREIISLKAGKNLSAHRIVAYVSDDIVNYADHENPTQINRLAGITLMLPKQEHRSKYALTERSNLLAGIFHQECPYLSPKMVN